MIDERTIGSGAPRAPSRRAAPADPEGDGRPGRAGPRILVGTVEIGGTIPDFADGLRRLGYRGTTPAHERHWGRPDIRYDLQVTPIIPWPSAIAESRSPLVRLPRAAANRAATTARMLNIIRKHDVFLFQWGGVSLTYGNSEYPLLKRLGKKIISFFSGSDVRYMPAYCQEFDALCRGPEFVTDRTNLEGVA